MELIFGGAYQGKLTWALQHFGLRLGFAPGYRLYYHLEDLTRETPDTDAVLPALLAADAVLSREIGAGIVPTDAPQRAWRERHGSLLQQLARQAEHVTRIFCGLPEVLK